MKRNSEAGFTLISVIMAVVILSIGIMALGRSQAMLVRAQATSAGRDVALGDRAQLHRGSPEPDRGPNLGGGDCRGRDRHRERGRHYSRSLTVSDLGQQPVPGHLQRDVPAGPAARHNRHSHLPVIAMRVRLPAGRAGFTLVELMIAMIVGLVVLAAATAVVASTWRGIAGGRTREGLERNARFINEALNRDLSETGVELASSVRFGSLSVRNDTLVILSVPYTNGLAAPPHTFQYGGAPLAPATGSCGTYCVDVDTVGFDLAPNDLALLQVNNERRLVEVTAVSVAGAVASVTFRSDTTLLHHEAAYARNLTLPNNGVALRKLRFVSYWVENGSLMRAQELNANGTAKGELIATGVDSIHVRLVFSNGVEATTASGTDGNGDNDWDDILAVRVNAWLQGDPVDRRVNNGQPVTRAYGWWFAPRNLRYEKNRIS